MLPPLLLRPATTGDSDAIRSCLKEYGEGAVDIRSRESLIRAILANSVIVLEAEKMIVGTASYFEREHGISPNVNSILSMEMGSLTLAPHYRRRGLAQLMAVCRITMILPGNDSVPILSEVYPTSSTSLRYLYRLGFHLLDAVPAALHQVAWQANAEKAVIYAVADPLYYARLCIKFADIARDRQVSGFAGSAQVTVSTAFKTQLQIMHFAQKPEYVETAFLNTDGIGYNRSVPRWLESHFESPCVSRSLFLAQSGLNPASWGHPVDKLDNLAKNFMGSFEKAAAAEH